LRFRVFSDLHVDANDGLAVPLNLSDCDAIIVAGDVCERMATRGIEWLASNLVPAGKPVIYVPGNHCFYHRRFPAELEAAKPAFEEAGVTLLARGETTRVGDVVVCGATLWTDFRIGGDQRQAMLAAADRHRGMNDHRRIRWGDGSRPFLPADAIREHAAAVEAIAQACRSARTVLVVTHHAPSPRSLRGGQASTLLDAAYASDLEPLIEELQPAAWIHGHVHRSADYRIGRTRVVSNPLGYCTQVGRGKAARIELENPAFDPGFTIEVGG
jgi:Icc-related predicted phosphoesterase